MCIRLLILLEFKNNRSHTFPKVRHVFFFFGVPPKCSASHSSNSRLFRRTADAADPAEAAGAVGVVGSVSVLASESIRTRGTAIIWVPSERRVTTGDTGAAGLPDTAGATTGCGPRPGTLFLLPRGRPRPRLGRSQLLFAVAEDKIGPRVAAEFIKSSFFTWGAEPPVRPFLRRHCDHSY